MTSQIISPNKCVRCGHEWYGKNPNEKPLACAGCKCKHWDRSPRVPKPKKELQCVGRAEKYGFSSLDVGGSKLVPWHNYSMSELAALTPRQCSELSEEKAKIYPAAMSYAKRKGWTISTAAIPGKGLLVKRLA